MNIDDVYFCGHSFTLGELIDFLETVEPDRVVTPGFCNPHSYRGDYAELAFEPIERTTAGEMLTAAKSALGTTYEGYKGGDFTMGEYTPVWLAWKGHGTGETLGYTLLSFMVGDL